MGRVRAVRRGDIWLVNLDPTIGHEIRKTRPAIIVQNDIGNEYSPTTIVAPLTTKGLEKTYPIQVTLDEKNSNLKRPAKALLDQVRAIDKRRLIKKQGSVSKTAMSKVDEALRISLGLIDVRE